MSKISYHSHLHKTFDVTEKETRRKYINVWLYNWKYFLNHTVSYIEQKSFFPFFSFFFFTQTKAVYKFSPQVALLGTSKIFFCKTKKKKTNKTLFLTDIFTKSKRHLQERSCRIQNWAENLLEIHHISCKLHVVQNISKLSCTLVFYWLFYLNQDCTYFPIIYTSDMLLQSRLTALLDLQ